MNSARRTPLAAPAVFFGLNVGGPNRVVGASTMNSCSGGDLLSHTLPGAVPSALWVLA
ncbi:hypothetical protein J2T23_003427, partial [Pseudarthrobacter niigatensis]|nr:hypothetical protein [Pseudarthrobacter niigatensis]MDQ0267451.1 hypothetical protein [Pseudarthrobacter niigatensis]